MEPRYYLRCLSEPTLLGPDGQPVKFRVRKHFALLIYLAIHGRTAQRREQLAELLWGSAPPGEARHSLATALSAIRGKLGRAALETTRDTVRFTHPHLTTDLDRLAAGDLFASEDRPMLEVAGFLDGLEVADAAEFMLWKEGQHARWLPEIHAALIQLMDRCRRTGDSRQIEVLADRMLVLDELSEAGIRAKMEARAFAGDRLTALRVFETWQRRLLAELQAEPSALVAGMAMRLRRRGWERPVADPIASVPTDRWKNRPFIGRRREYRVLYEGWEATQRGEPRHVLLLGESGIGKSTLAERLTTAAGLEGASAARVQCYEPEQGIPYAAVTSLILQLLDRPGASATPPEALAELSRTVPEVRRRFPSIPPAVESEGEASRIRLTEAFHELLTAVAEEHPVILIIDDLHFTDDASLAVLHLVLRKARRQPLQVVLLTRSEELLKSPSAARLRENATALGFAVLEVPPLTEDETEELIRSLVPAEGPQPGPTVRRRLLQGSAGYPMVAELLVQDWLEHGDRCLALSVTAMTTELAPQAGSAAAYHAIVDRVMRSLDPTTRNVLSLASILGSRLNDVSKYALLDLTMGQTMASLARLTDLRLLRDGAHGLEFVNELVRGQVYTATPKSLRKSLHGSIANLLLADPADADDLETAWHCVRSGRVEEARPRIISGAQACIERGALHEAELGLRSGLYLLNGEDRLSGMMLIAEVLQEQGQWRDTLGVLAEIQDELAQPTTAPRWRQISAALSARSRSRLESIPAFEVGEVVERLLRGLPSDADNKTAALTASACAATVAYERDADLAATTLTRLDQIRPSDWPLMELGRWLLSRAILSYYAGRINECTEAISEAATRLKVEVNPSSLAAEILLGLGALGCAKGEYAEAVTHLMRAADLAKRIGNDTLYCSATTNLALCHGRLKHFEAQIAWAKLALANGRFQGAYNRLQCLYNLARGHAALGHEGEALNAVSALAAASLDSAPVYVDQARYLFCAEANALLARSGQAERFSVLGVEGRNAKLHSASFAGLYARGLVRAQHHVGDAEVRTRLEALIKKMGSYDLPDQEEIREAYLRLFGKTCDT